MKIPKQVELNVYANQIEVRGSLGTVYINTLHWVPTGTNTFLRVLENAIIGVSIGFLRKLRIQGSGYRVVSVEQDSLILRIGYSHDVKLPIPKGVVARANKHNQLLCIGVDKQVLGQFCASVEKARPYNIYKKKGIFPVGAVVPTKSPGKPGIIY